MKIWFVPDFMYEAILWGIKAIDLVLVAAIALAIHNALRFVRWAVQLNDSGELE